MLNLAIDTCTRWGRFALAEQDRILEYRPLNVSGSYADALLPVIQEMLAAGGRSQEDLTAIGVTVGPGSFTGVRIGVATAKGLAWGLGCNLFPVTSLAAMAAALLVEHPEAQVAVPVLDARRGEVFSGLFVRDGGWVRSELEERAEKPDRWWASLLESGHAVDSMSFGGDGAGLLLGQGKKLRPELIGRGTPVLRSWSSVHPATAPGMALAMGAGALTAADPFALVPEYLRVSDAEVKRRVDLTPTSPEPGESMRPDGEPSP